MAAAAFSRLFELEQNQYLPGCPVLLSAGALLKNEAGGQLIVQLKFTSLSEKKISAVIVRILPKDVLERELAPKEYQYLDLNVLRYQAFGEQTPVFLEKDEARSYSVAVQSVVFADGTAWTPEECIPGEPLPAPVPLGLSADLTALYHGEMRNHRLSGRVQEKNGLTQCGCGFWNAGGDSCYYCGASFEKQQKLCCEEALAPILNAQKEQKAAQEQAVREKEARAAQEREALLAAQAEQKKQQAAQLKKIMLIAGPAAAALILVIVLLCTVVIPGAHYRTGESFMEQGDYYAAYESFTAAGGYSDAPDRASINAMLLGNEYLDDLDYDRALWAYELSGNSPSISKANQYLSAGQAELSETAYSLPLPEGVFLYTGPAANGDKAEVYGLLSVGENRWITPSYRAFDHFYDGDEHIFIFTGAFDARYLLNWEDGSRTSLGKCASVIGAGDGLICFRDEDGLCGYYDSEGNLVIEPQYTDAKAFSGGMAAVCRDGLWGYIDKEGNTVIDFQFNDAGAMESGYAKVYLNRRHVKEGNLYKEIPAGWGLIDASGSIIVEPVWADVVTSTRLSFGLTQYETYSYIAEGVVKTVDADGKCALYSLDGKILLSGMDIIDVFSEGLAYVMIESSSYYPVDIAGFVNNKGEMVIDLVEMGYDGAIECDPFKNGVTTLSAWIDEGKFTRSILYGVLNREGKVLIPISQEWVSVRDSGLVEICANEFNEVTSTYRAEDGQLRYYTPDKETPFIAQWDWVSSYSEEGIAYVQLGKKYGFITQDETILIDPIYDSAASFSEGLAAVREGSLWGYINTDGEMVIEPQFADAQPFSRGAAFVKADDSGWSIINQSGEILASGFDGRSFFSESGYAVVEKNGEKQIITADGERVF